MDRNPLHSVTRSLTICGFFPSPMVGLSTYVKFHLCTGQTGSIFNGADIKKHTISLCCLTFLTTEIYLPAQKVAIPSEDHLYLSGMGLCKILNIDDTQSLTNKTKLFGPPVSSKILNHNCAYFPFEFQAALRLLFLQVE